MIPDEVRAAAHAALDDAHVDERAVVADIVTDTALEPDASAGNGARRVRFQAADRVVDVLVASPESTLLDVRLDPATAVSIRLASRSGQRLETTADERGRAELPRLEDVVTLLVDWPEQLGGPTQTAWLRF